MAVLALLVSCSQKQERIVTPYGSVLDSVDISEDFDLAEIQTSGELIMATLTGPQTYYDYHGKSMGTQYFICQRFADSLGVHLRVEVCRDSLELAERLKSGEIDLVAWATPGQISVDENKPELVEEMRQWYRPSRIEEAKNEEYTLLTVKKVRRRIFSPMLDKKGGIISHYDHLFMTYSRDIRWDWRLLAAQCYQESTFDPKAVSFVGAKGLMQIMPGTADHLGVSRSKLYDPETNVAAGVKYIGELQRTFSDIRDQYERQQKNTNGLVTSSTNANARQKSTVGAIMPDSISPELPLPNPGLYPVQSTFCHRNIRLHKEGEGKSPGNIWPVQSRHCCNAPSSRRWDRRQPPSSA